jgi:hypothetical protein
MWNLCLKIITRLFGIRTKTAEKTNSDLKEFPLFSKVKDYCHLIFLYLIVACTLSLLASCGQAATPPVQEPLPVTLKPGAKTEEKLLPLK